jgi:retron-type reverse transcriptase
MFKKKTIWDKPFSEKVSKRVSKIPTSELEMWIDQSLYEIGKCMTMYSKTRENIYLEEALVGAEALHAVVDELKKRATR